MQGASQDIIRSLGVILNEMACYWEILSRRVIRYYLHCARLTLDVELRICCVEVKGTNVEAVAKIQVRDTDGSD